MHYAVEQYLDNQFLSALTKVSIRDDCIRDDMQELCDKAERETYRNIKKALLKSADNINALTYVSKMFETIEKNAEKRGKKEAAAQIVEARMAEYNLINSDGVDLRSFCVFNDNGKLTGVFKESICNYIKKHYKLMVYGRVLYIYDNGVYVADNKGAKEGTKLKTIIRKLIPHQLRDASLIMDIFTMITQQDADIVAEDADINQQPDSWINFKNCYLDLRTMATHAHDPKYRTTNQVPWDYIPENLAVYEGNNIKNFLEFAFHVDDTCSDCEKSLGNDSLEAFLEFCASTMTTSRKFQTICFLSGKGGTGKSILIKMARWLVGDKNCSSVEFQDLSLNRFSSSRLVNKLLNACADVKTDAMRDSSKVKQISGDDKIEVEQKNKDGFETEVYAKLLFSVNGFPTVLNEEMNGLFRRLMIININRIPTVKDADLPAKIEKEMPYFVNLVVQAGHKLWLRGDFIRSAEIENNVKHARKNSDSVFAFLEDCCEIGPNLSTLRNELYEAYTEYCESEQYVKKSAKNFYNDLRGKGIKEPEDSTSRLMIGVEVKKNRDSWVWDARISNLDNTKREFDRKKFEASIAVNDIDCIKEACITQVKKIKENKFADQKKVDEKIDNFIKELEAMRFQTIQREIDIEKLSQNGLTLEVLEGTQMDDNPWEFKVV